MKLKTFKQVILWVVAVIVVLLLVGFLLPGSYRVERSVTMGAVPQAVFARLNNFRRWQEWSAWTVEKFPDMKVRYQGPEFGQGAEYFWEGKSSGQGTMKITQSETNMQPVAATEHDSSQSVCVGNVGRPEVICVAVTGCFLFYPKKEIRKGGMIPLPGDAMPGK